LFSYLEEPKPSEIVMVGSSIFANVIDEAFEGISNISFDGGNALTGLHIITEVEDVPEVIFVEMGLNALVQSQGPHAAVLKLFEERDAVLLRRKCLHSSRKENNLHLRFRTWVRNVSTGKQKRGLVKANPYFYERALGQYLHRQKERTVSGFYDREVVQIWLKDQKVLIDGLVERGSKVVLVRSPEAEEMREVRAHEYEVEEKVFPKDQYNWVDPQTWDGSFGTSDGIHLLRDDSMRLLSKLRHDLKASRH
jgi:hypothetical protein